MKYLTFALLLVFTSCASRPKPQVTVRPMPAPVVEPVDSVRFTEVIRAYHIGRYVDPNHPDVMHEQHPVFRVEAVSRWNLKPGDPCAPGAVLLNPPRDAAFSPPPANDAVVAEMNRQKDATERVMREARKLATTKGSTAHAVSATKSSFHRNTYVNQTKSVLRSFGCGLHRKPRIFSKPRETDRSRAHSGAAWRVFSERRFAVPRCRAR
jgi:hypothetical protein